MSVALVTIIYKVKGVLFFHLCPFVLALDENQDALTFSFNQTSVTVRS